MYIYVNQIVWYLSLFGCLQLWLTNQKHKTSWLHIGVNQDQDINNVLESYTLLFSLCDCKSLSFYFGINSEIWILDSNSWVAKNMNGGGMGGGGKKYELPYIPRKVEQGDMEEKVKY